MKDQALKKAGLIAVVTDILAVAVYWLLRPEVYSRFQDPSPVNALVLLLLYLVFCLCVYLTRRLNPGPETAKSRGMLGLLGVFFGFMFTFVTLDSGGFLESPAQPFDLDSLPVSLGLTFGIVVWFGLIFLYPAILWADIRPVRGRIERGAALHFLSLSGINLMILVTAVHWEVYFADVEPYESVSPGGKLLIFALVFLFFLLFYAPPRLLFLLRNPAPLALASFLIQCGIYVYLSLSGKAW